MKSTKMSEAEKEIMQIVWAAGGPITSNEILDMLPADRSLKITTVLTFLTRLTEKGLLTSMKKGKKNFYAPLVTEDEYRKIESKVFLQAIHGGSIKSFFAALCDADEISVEEIEELKKWLSQR